MVEINNQRKAFLDILAWSEELITDVRKPRNHEHDVICRRRAVYGCTSHPHQTCHAKPKTQIAGGRYQLLSVGGMPTASSLAWKTTLRKLDGAVALQQIKGVALYLGDRGDIRQAIDVAAISGLHCRGAGYADGSKSIRLTAWLQNSKRAERSEIDVWQSHHWISPLWLSASSSACHGLPITVITPLPTKPSATKNARKSWQARQLLTCRCVWRCCCARCKIHEGVSWC